MKALRRLSLFAALWAAPLQPPLGGCPDRAASRARPLGLAGAVTAPPTAAQQFYTRLLGDWVGIMVSRLNGAEPATGYFHLVIARVDASTFREAYTFYRLHPKTGVLERSGTQSVLSTIESSAVIRQTCRGSGTVLIDFQPKGQSFEAEGVAHFTSPDHLEGEARGKIAVDGLPLNLGKHGQLRKATATIAQRIV